MKLVAVVDEGESLMSLVELTGDKRRVETNNMEFVRDAVVLYWERLPIVMLNASTQVWRVTCDLRNYASVAALAQKGDVDITQLERVHHQACIDSMGYPFSLSRYSNAQS